MGSRRTMTRSFSEGRASNGSNTNGSSRPGGCIYLSNVRPGNRSTLCSMMAQLAEETQPSFETTLKSKAVSENCNVKFACVVTGHPVPQVIWYKDDEQLDRYCGLPKYEIFRNGKNHTLHIYNCTVEDAAIYQASASNSKGIVSCSGVLEVGEMNEFKIHQRYFAKLKQKAENRHREVEGKENQEPLRTISPDRTQRKRRSTMESFLSTPSSTEDEGSEESHQAVAAETEDRLQEAAVDKVEEKPVPITNGAVSPITNGQNICENGNKSGTYVYDSTQKIFTAVQPKAPFVKKKIKISGSAKVAKSDTPGERKSEERRAKDDMSAPVRYERNSEENMEVENTVSSSVVDSESINLTKHKKTEVPLVERPSKDENIRVEATAASQKTSPVPPAALTSHTASGADGKQAAKLQKQSEHTDMEKQIKMQKQGPQITSTQLHSRAAAVSQQQISKAKEDVSKTEHAKVMVVDVKSDKSAGLSVAHRDTESVNASCEIRTDFPQRPCSAPASLQQLSRAKEDVFKTEHITVMDVDEKSDTSTGASFAHTNTESVNAPCEIKSDLPQRPCAAPSPQQQLSKAKGDSPKPEHVMVMVIDEKSDTPTNSDSVNTPCAVKTDLTQRPCEQAGDQVSEKETSPCQKNVCVSRPAPRCEVTQAHAMTNRNDAPVNLELPLTLYTTDAQPPQKAPSERDTSTDDIQTPSLPCGLQAAIYKITQDTWDHSRGSDESHTVLFTDLQKSPLQSPFGGGENPAGYNVSPSVQQSQVDTAIKTVEGTEIQVDEKVGGREVGELFVQSDSVAATEKIVAMETESATVHVTEHSERQETKDAAHKDITDASIRETEKNEHVLKMMEESSPESHSLKSNKSEPDIPVLTKSPESTNFQEVQKPATKVISIAELLRSQIKALESSLAYSLSTMPLHADFIQDQTKASTEACKELTDGSKRNVDVTKSVPERGMEPKIYDTVPNNIKDTLMDVYNQLNQTHQEHIQAHIASSPPDQSVHKPSPILPMSVLDTGSSKDTARPHVSANKDNEGVMDVCQNMETPIPVKDRVSLSGSESVKPNIPSSISKDELINRSISSLTEAPVREPGSPLTAAPIKSSYEKSNMIILEHGKDESVQRKDIGFTQKLSPDIKLKTGTTETLLDHYKLEEDNKNISSLQSLQKFPTKRAPGTNTERNNSQPTLQDNSIIQEFSRMDSMANSAHEASPMLKRRDCVSPIPSATAQELASGARRKILVPKAKPEEASEATSPVDNQRKEVSPQSSKLSPSPATLSTSPSLSRRSPLLQLPGEQTVPTERRSPLLSRRKMASESQAPSQQPTEEHLTARTQEKPAEKEKPDPFKAPQVIRKIRAETYADASGHLKLWCQFFNVLSDSTIKWHRNEEAIAKFKKNAGDESQVNLAIVQASSRDSGVYGCTITNEYGTDSTDCLLSSDILAGMALREDLGVGEEIEMTPMIFSKGVADPGIWGNKFFGRIMVQESHIGEGCSHKVWRAKVIYGLEPVFESGNTCIIKVRNHIAYDGKGESSLIDKNLETIKQECKIQNLAREYCKIFSAEARAIENFGPSLEVIPVYLMYRPANTVPYGTVEADLTGGVYQRYSVLDKTGRLYTRSGSEVEQKCCALQHWIFQWTNGNMLLSQLEGVDTKITNIGISVKSTGHQGLPVEGNPKVFEQFVSEHQCNYFCGLLSLRSVKVMDSLLTPAKPKGSRSPLLQRKMAAGSSSPQTGRKAAGSPRMPRKMEPDGRQTPTKQKAAEAPKAVKME